MPSDKDRKRIIRERMKKTGESYTTARTQIIARTKPKAAAGPPIDHAARAGMRDERIAATTGRTWAEWTRVLDADGAAAMPHGKIAALVHGKHGVGDWWAQTVTVGYERIKGLRELNQRRSGEYEAGKSKTVGVDVDTLFDAWAKTATRRRWLDADVVVRTATRPKSIRLQWPDGTIVVAGFTPKSDEKSTVSVQHTKLRDKTALENAKKFWAEKLAALQSLLG
jgi:hypothetical protein